MALLDFPTGPQLNDTTTQNGNTWKWNGTSWVAFNNLSLSSQVTGILGTIYGGTGKSLSSLTVGSVIYADSSSSFAALPPGSNNYVLASAGTGNTPYWKVDDSGTGSVGSGVTGGFAYYTGLNSITSGSGFSFIAGSGNGGTIIFTNGLLSLIGSTINSGTWAGSAVTLAYGGTNNTISGIGHSYRIAMYDAAGTAITNIPTTSGIANSVLFQSTFTSAPIWQGQSQLVVGGATTAAQWQTARTVTFATGDVTGSFSINGSADVSNVALTIAANSVALGTDTTGNYAASVSTSGNGISTIGTAGEGTAFTIDSNATSSNTSSTLVFRDGSGNFSAGTITANLTGTASIASSAAAVNTVTDTANTLYLLGSRSSTGIASTQVYVDTNISILGNTITAANFSGLATSASNILGGVSGAGSSIHIQTGVNTTGFLAHPGVAGYALTTTSNGLVYGALSSIAVTSLTAGNGISVSASTGAVTVSNIGVTSITGTANRITVTSSLGSSNGAITLNLPQDIATTSTPTFSNIIIDGGTSSTLATVGSSPTSMVNKQYVDNLASGLDIHGSVRAVSVSAIGASYVQSQAVGTAATGAYLISTTQVALPSIDGVTFTATGTSQRILIAGGSTGRTSINGGAFSTAANATLSNGIYYVGALGGAGTSNWILVRATDTDESTELTGGTFTFVEEGSLYADTGWVCSNDTTNLGPIQFGSTAISFTQFTGAAAISFGQGLTKVGNTVATNVNLSPTGAASGVGYTQFNIGGQSVGGAADTGYYPTFSVRTSGTTVSGSALLTLNSDGFSLVGSTNTNRTLTVTGGDITLTGGGNTLTLTGSISLPAPTQYALAFGTSATALGFLPVGTASSILFQSNNTTNPAWVGQNTLVVGGATTAAQWQTARTVTFATGDVTGSFSINGSADVSNVALTIAANSVALGTDTTGNYAASVSTSGNGISTIGTAGEGTAFTIDSNATSSNTSSTLVFRDGSGNFSAGTITANLTGTASIASSAATVNTVTDVANTLYLLGSRSSTGIASTQVYVDTNISILGSTITATNFSGIASSATRVGITTSVGAGTSYLYFGEIANGYGAIGATTSITVTASTGTITATNFSGIASSATRVGITTSVGAGTSYLYFGQIASGYGAIGATTSITVTASTGTITATNFSGLASSSSQVVTTADTSTTLYLLGTRTSGGTSGTIVYVDSSVSVQGVQVTAGVWAGTAISLARGGTNNTIAGNGHSSKVAVYDSAGTSITSYSITQGNVIFGATGGTFAGLASTLLPVSAISDAPPAQPGGAIGATQPGQLWWDSQYGVLKIFYNDGNTSQWVDATPVLGSSGGGSSVKRSYVMTFGAGFTPSTGADTVQIQVPYAPDNTSKYYYIKRLDYRNETVSTGAGVSFFIDRHTTGNASFSSANRIHSGSGLSFVASAGIYITSYTLSGTGASFVSSSGVAGSVISGDYLRLNFAAVNSAATLSVSIVLEEQ